MEKSVNVSGQKGKVSRLLIFRYLIFADIVNPNNIFER